MKRVCHISTVHSRYDNRIFQKECRSLAEAGYEVFLVVNDEAANETCEGVTIVSGHKKRNGRLARILLGPWDVYREARKLHADFYHLHDPELLIIGKKLKKAGKVIFDSHEFAAEQIREKYYIPKVLRAPLAEIYKHIEKKIVSQIDALIVPCTYAGKDYFHGHYKKIAYVDNVPEKCDIPNVTIPYKERKHDALYLGGLTVIRGTIKMIEAAYLAETRLSIGGGFSPKELKAELERRKEYATVDYCGVLNRKQVQEILCDSKMGICVLQDAGQYRSLDNLPTKIYEYMAAEIPVIVSDFPYYKKIIEENGAGICVNPADEKAIAEAMRYLKENQEEAERIGKNGRRLIETVFNWEREKSHLLDLYQELLDNR